MLEQFEKKPGEMTWDQLRIEFGQYLGAGEAVPSPVLKRALEDLKFYQYLLLSRNEPAYLQALFNDPQNKTYDTAKSTSRKSNVELVFKAATALLKWSKSGFKPVEEAEFNRRFQACRNCEYLVAPPDQMVYKIKFSKDVDLRICSQCGCVASRKARLPDEQCPVPDPLNPMLNKWAQPVVMRATSGDDKN